MSYVVFPTSNVVFPALVLRHFVGAYSIRPVRHCVNRIDEHAKPLPPLCKTHAFRAYAIRPYGGAFYWFVVYCTHLYALNVLSAKTHVIKTACLCGREINYAAQT